jgi:GNAT superfamily N-acetyltransferase
MKTEQAAAIRCRPAHADDMRACAAILNRWIDETPWMPRVHSHADVERHYRETVFGTRDVAVADCGGAVAGFISLSDDHCVTGFYVDNAMRRKGCGKALLDHAKAKHSDGLWLWTFQANSGARRFYVREGFHEVRRTDGDNEEGLPDILFEWRPA